MNVFVRSFVSALVLAGAVARTPAFDYFGSPIGWAWGTDEPGQRLIDVLGEGFRPLSLDQASSGLPYGRFRATYVSNAGGAYRETRVVPNLTLAEVNSEQGSQWRLVEAEQAGTGTFVGIYHRDPSTVARNVFFSNKTSSEVGQIIGTARRLLEIDSIVVGGVRRFSGIVTPNTGGRARAWGWMPNATLTQISDWANANNMRVIDLDPRSTTHYAAVFVQREPGVRYQFLAGPLSKIQELQEVGGTRFQVLNKLEGQDWYAAITVNVVNAQNQRVSNLLLDQLGKGGGRAGAFVREIGVNVPIVDLRGDRDFYPMSSIKVLIHAAGLSQVPEDQLNSYKIGTRRLRDIATNMMVNSNNPDTYTLNAHWGTAFINEYGRTNLGTTEKTWIATHYGNPPPDGNYNANSTLREMTNIYANRNVLGSTRVASFRAWMRTEANSSLLSTVAAELQTELGLTNAQFTEWASRVRYEFKAGSLGSTEVANTHWCNIGRMTLPYKTSLYTVLRSYVFGHFVEETATSYDNGWADSASLMREQIRASMLTYR